MAKGVVSVQVTDSRGISATTNAYINVADATTLTVLSAAIAAWLDLFQNVTAGRITRATFKLVQDVTGHAADPIGAGSIVNDCLALKFPNTATPSAPWDFIVPAINVACIVANSDQPDMAEGATIDLLADSMETGFTGSNWTDNKYVNLAAVAGGFLPKRKLGRRKDARSRAPGA